MKGGKKQMPFLKKKPLTEMEIAENKVQDFFDHICPGMIKFYTDYYICGNTYRTVWAIKEYPPSTEEQAILRHLGERDGITLRMYSRYVTHIEQRKIIQNATRKNKLMSTNNDIQETVTAQSNLQDVVELIANMRKNKEPLLHCAIYIELTAGSQEDLRELQAEVMMELSRSKITVDKLFLRQKEGFISVMPCGNNVFGNQFERVLPASSVANLYPFNYSGKTDHRGFYIGRDKYGTSIITDFDCRADDKSNSNILILGNSGQGKSHLLKLILTNFRESGKSVLLLDGEDEYIDLTHRLGGCHVDLMSGEYMINVLEPKAWSDGKSEDEQEPDAFKKMSRISQHIAFLKDFFKSYKCFADTHIDTLEIMLIKLYHRFHITDETIYSTLNPKNYPILSDLYDLIEMEYMSFDKELTGQKMLYTEEILQELCLGIYSMCKGSESKYFNGYTNITDDKFICFGVKGLLETNKNLRNAMLFNILSYMSNVLLTQGNAVASIDELYLFLTNLTAVEYTRNLSKRVRKKDSVLALSSQNLEDFNLPEIREYTKPLFSIPTHTFLFNAGNIDSKFYIDMLQLEQSEFDLIKYPERGTCLYKCGNERYLLQVIAPDYKSKLFGSAGGR